MPEINLYPEMNAQIADLLLDCTDSGMMLYAGTYIKELERQLAEYQKMGTVEEIRRALQKQIQCPPGNGVPTPEPVV